MSSTSSFIDILLQNCHDYATRIAYTFIEDGEAAQIQLTYGQLDREARKIGGHLQKHCRPGGKAILLLPSGLEFIKAFYGCLYAGIIAVPAYPPRMNRTIDRLSLMIDNAGISVILADSATITMIGKAPFFEAGRFKLVDIASLDTEPPEQWKMPRIQRDDIAFLQYTSGSTGNPKGAMVSHGNILHNLELIKSAFGQDHRSVVVGWLPFYHDMGLIGNIFQPIYGGGTSILFSPVHFLQKPSRWLDVITKYRATTSGGPNFAYDLCVNRVSNEHTAMLDLSSWEVAFCGAEPARAKTFKEFSEKFRSCGFDRRAFRHCYGLAEATLFVSTSAKDSTIKEFLQARLSYTGDTLNTQNYPATTVSLIGCGVPKPEDIVIVGVDHGIVEEGKVGEIWLKGDSIVKGYYNMPELSAEVFGGRLPSGEGPFLKTGDLGMLSDGELYITGRIKDLIIIHGRNIYPQDLENLVTGMRIGLQSDMRASITIEHCAVFSIEKENMEKLIVLAEINNYGDLSLSDTIDKIARLIFQTFELPVEDILLIKKGNILRTTSGKIQRHACRNAYLNGRFRPIAQYRTELPVAITNGKSIYTPTERKIMDIMQGILGQPLEPGDNFHSHGLDSIKSIRATTELSFAFHKELTADLIYNYPTIMEIAARIDSIPAKRYQRIAATTEKACYAISPIQKSIWFNQQLNPRSNAYNIPLFQKIPGLNTNHLEKALNFIVCKYEIFRTYFIMEHYLPKQVIHPFQYVPLKETLLASRKEAAGYAASLSGKKFDLERHPLWRAEVVKSPFADPCLLFVIHHIISDGYSLYLIQKELMSTYADYCMDKIPERRFPEIQYKDYAEWIYTHPPVMQDMHQAFWKRHLAGPLPYLNLSGGSRNAKAGESSSCSMEISSSLLQNFRNISKEKGLSLYGVLLSGFAILLQKLSGETDLVIGAPVLNRELPGTSHMPGPCINTVMLRIGADPKQTICELLGQVKNTVQNAVIHGSYPFDRMLEDLNISPDLNKFPLSSVFFNGLTFIEGDEPAYSPDLFPSNFHLDCQFDLNCYVSVHGTRLQVRFDYKKALFSEEIIKCIIRKYEQILDQISKDPDIPIHSIKTNAIQERHLCFRDPPWYQTGQSIPEILYRQFDRFKHNTAVGSGFPAITYERLNMLTNQWARYILRLSEEKRNIGFYVTHNENLALSIISILKAGCTYVPFDSRYPQERLEFILRDCNPSIIITDDLHLEKVRQLHYEPPITIINLDEYADLAARENQQDLPIITKSEDIAYILYTSGSTGVPKGVMQTHKNTLHFASAYTAHIGIDPNDKLIGLCPCCYDSFNNDFYGAILNGACYVPVLPSENADGHALALSVIDRGITIWHSTPALFRFYCRQWIEAKIKIPSLRIIKMTGDAVRQDDFYHFKAIAAPHAKFVISLGSTESSLNCIHSYAYSDEPTQAVLPVGYPVGRTLVLILDEGSNELDALELGEIVIESDHVAPGYLNRKEHDKEHFKIVKGKRRYHTRDMGRKLPDGNIEWLGRKGEYIKVQGNRVELGEIEHYLLKYPSIKEAVVVTKEDGKTRETMLVGYIVCSAETDHFLLRDFLKNSLPEYMIPAYFMTIDRIPLTPNEKIDRRILSALPDDKLKNRHYRDHVPPTTDLEFSVFSIWKEILGTEKIGINDSFFELGGQSLKAMLLIVKIKRHFNISIDLIALFKNPTIADICHEIERSQQADGGSRAGNNMNDMEVFAL